VIAAHGTPWRKVEEAGCGLWTSNEPLALATAIDQMEQLPLSEMGRRGRAWIERNFSWSKVTSEMLGQYRALIQTAAIARPEPAPPGS